MTPPGVVHSLAPPPNLSASIAAAVERTMRTIPPDKHGALITVVTESGANLVVAVRTPGGAVQAQAWIGKSGWDRPLEAGGQLVVTF